MFDVSKCFYRLFFAPVPTAGSRYRFYEDVENPFEREDNYYLVEEVKEGWVKYRTIRNGESVLGSTKKISEFNFMYVQIPKEKILADELRRSNGLHH